MSITYSVNKEYEEPSRYQILRVINDDGARYLETYNQVSVPDTEEDFYHIVKDNEEGRLDIISQNYYGTPIYWWAIAIANDFIDPYVVNAGTMVRIPSLSSLIDPVNGILTRRGDDY